MRNYYLAVDIGASSGRLILAWKEDGKICLEEIHRFPNGMMRVNGELCWDIPNILEEIKYGLKKCAYVGKIPAYMGIDTWGVDFVLLDKRGKLLGKCVGYRDPRTRGMSEKVEKQISAEELYQRTGIQKQDFNTIYQLYSIKQKEPEKLKKASSFLMVPEYLNYLLTGVIKNEYTNATTTQLVNAHAKNWDSELIELLGFPKQIFGQLFLPGEEVGDFLQEVQREVGFNCRVVLPATHDTGSAVLAIPAMGEESLYISSGTWSLMGTERTEADCRKKSMVYNFTNEGGYQYRFRYLKNIMGMWMIQSVKKELAENMSYAEICAMASSEKIASVIDCNDTCFILPDNMTETIKAFCKKTGQQIPEGIGQIAAVIYKSLALNYAETAKEIEEMTGMEYSVIHVIGGGSQAEYLNQLTAEYTKKTVKAGPAEATAIGNVLVQMIKAGEYKDLNDARVAISHSFPIKTYKNK